MLGSMRSVLGAKYRAGGGGGILLFRDTFTDTDNTLLSAHTPDIDTVGGGWNIYSTTPRITDVNTADGDTRGSFLEAAHVDVGLSQDIKISIKLPASTQIGLAFRVSADGRSYYILRYHNSTNLYFIRRENSAWNNIGEISVGNLQSNFVLTVFLRQTTLDIAIDGIMQATDIAVPNLLTNTGVGYFCNYPSRETDDLEVETL